MEPDPHDFDAGWLDRDTVSWPAAYALAQASALAYAPRAAVETQIAQDWKMPGVFLEAFDTECFIAHAPRCSILAFRGTQEPRDWLANLRLMPAAFDPLGGRVHGGFLQAWSVIAPQVRAALDDLGARKLWVTGHSLGGALAVLAAAEFSAVCTGVITFGQPRVLRRGSAERFNQMFGPRYLRLVNRNDIVPRVPPNFRHTGQLGHFDAFGKRINAEGPLESTGTDDSHNPPELSEAEFEALQTALSQAPGPQALEGQMTGVPAHGVHEYVALARRKAR